MTTLGGASESVLIREVSFYPKSHYVLQLDGTSAHGHENSVVIRELSLYPQSLLAKLTVLLLDMGIIWITRVYWSTRKYSVGN